MTLDCTTLYCSHQPFHEVARYRSMFPSWSWSTLTNDRTLVYQILSLSHGTNRIDLADMFNAVELSKIIQVEINPYLIASKIRKYDSRLLSYEQIKNQSIKEFDRPDFFFQYRNTKKQISIRFRDQSYSKLQIQLIRSSNFYSLW